MNCALYLQKKVSTKKSICKKKYLKKSICKKVSEKSICKKKYLQCSLFKYCFCSERYQYYTACTNAQMHECTYAQFLNLICRNLLMSSIYIEGSTLDSPIKKQTSVYNIHHESLNRIKQTNQLINQTNKRDSWRKCHPDYRLKKNHLQINTDCREEKKLPVTNGHTF